MQEQAMTIKERLSRVDLTDFTASNDWLESFWKIHGITEYHVNEAAGV